MKKTTPEAWLKLGIIALFIVAMPAHFIYQWSNQNPWIGAIFPVNESIFEHLKLVITPIFVWYYSYYLVNRKTASIKENKWFLAMLVSIFVSIIFIPSFHYTLDHGLGLESLALDIFDLFIALALGQLLALHVYHKSKGVNYKVSLLVGLILIGCATLFTFKPPQLPIFIDENYQQSGIIKK